MTFDKIVIFWRYTFQGIAIASWGTMGVTPSWGGFVLGLVSCLIGFALLGYEKGA